MEEENPYAAPQQSAVPPDPLDPWPLKRPGIMLILLSILMILGLPLSLFGNHISGMIPTGGLALLKYIGGYAAFAMVSFITLLGGIAMVRKFSYRLATFGAFVASIPMVGPLYVLAIPFGIWALIELDKPEVRETFDRVQTERRQRRKIKDSAGS